MTHFYLRVLEGNVNVRGMFDPKEYLAEFDCKLHYNYFVSVALAQGQYDLIVEFFRQIPKRETKGAVVDNSDK